MPFKTIDEIKSMVEEDRKISQNNKDIDRYLTPWVNGRNYFDGMKFPLFPGYKKLAKKYHDILYNKE